MDLAVDVVVVVVACVRHPPLALAAGGCATEGEFGGDGQSIFSVRQSRLGVKANGTLYDRPYEAKFEFDLWQTPHSMQEGAWTVKAQDAKSVTFERAMKVTEEADFARVEALFASR